MSQSMINFRMDSDLKKRMEETCKKMGLTMTAAFTMFATKVTNEQRIPFEITADPFYSQANMEELEKRAESDMKIGFAVYPVDVSDLLKVSDNDMVMPPKSTWFEPKLASGLFMHRLK